MIPQTKIEQAAKLYVAETVTQCINIDITQLREFCKLDFTAGVRFAEREMGKAQTFDIDFAGHVNAKIEFKDGELTIIAAMNGWGEALDPDQIIITKPTHENES